MPARSDNGRPKPADRPERLGVNLHDLDRVDPLLRGHLLAGLDLTQAVWVDGQRVDETAVVFVCPLLRAACLLDVVRGHDRQAGDAVTRAYLRRATAWERLPADALLTTVAGGRVVLNPFLFSPVIRVSASTAGPSPVAVRMPKVQF